MEEVKDKSEKKPEEKAERKAEKKTENKNEKKPEEKEKTKTETKSETEPKKEKAKDKKKGKKVAIITAIVAVLVAVCLIVYFAVFAKTTLDMSKYFELSYDGYNGYATVEGKLKEKDLKKAIKDSSVARRFIKKLNYEIKNDEDLSNGDKVEVKFNISNSFLEENKLKLKSKTVKFTVSGLEEAKGIDLADYVELEYTGFNKHASATVSLKDDLKDVIGKDNFKDLKDVISFTVTNDGKLENGKDAEIEATISDSWCQEHGVEIASKEFTVPVDGLEEATEVDGFSGLDVEVTGMSPDLSLTVNNNSTDEFIKTVKYKASKTSGIKNGDTIKITISSYDEDMAEEKGYVFKEDSYDYKVEGKAAYVYNVSEVTDSVKTQIKSTFIEKAKSKAAEDRYYGDGNVSFDNYESGKVKVRENTDYKYATVTNLSDLTMGEPEVVAMYLLTKKEGSYARSTNKIVGIVKIPYTSSANGTTYNWYATVSASNFSLTDGGAISENAMYDTTLDDGKNQEEAYENYVNDEKNDYDVANISL